MVRIVATVGLWQYIYHDRVLVSLKKMGGAINHSLISAHFSISAYFLTIQTYKRMHLTTQVMYNVSLPVLCTAVV